MKSLKIGKKRISQSTKPYIIAEIGVNHEGSMALAKQMIRQAKAAGLDAVKFQTYKAEKLVIKKSPAYWDTKKEKIQSQFELFKKYDKFNKQDYLEIYKFCKSIGIDFLSTPFDIESVSWLKNLMPAIKIASADIDNYPLLRAIGLTKKKVFISTGASKLREIENAIRILNKFGSQEIVIMHCILNYPTKDSDANLNMIEDLKKKFPKNFIGYSDHTLPSKSISPCSLAYQLGARVIEKHFTYNKKKSGNDHYHSMDYNDAKLMINQINKIYEYIGNIKSKNFIQSELKSRKYARRSIVAKVDIKRGEKFTSQNITTKRPGNGISPMKWVKIIGKKSKNIIKADTQLRLKDIS